ncbi:trypsin-like [Belonocnema kinseyi]|uniref:trypsin-like n=1 Tax=Belonocnema kinseyi TaxID=2817044 RepID=UPI00143D3D11|nr:trypsin-like [Belonocnema kinseyi]
MSYYVCYFTHNLRPDLRMRAPNIVILEGASEESSEIHIRPKRVIDLTNVGRWPVHILSASYIVNILKDNISACSGSILSARFVLTVCQCVYPLPLERYSILSGSEMSTEGTNHAMKKLIYVEPNPKLVLVEVSPQIDIHGGPNKPIHFFSGVVPDLAYGTFSGWGCVLPEKLEYESLFPSQLMQTRLPIISLEECIRIYEGRVTITDKQICTLDTSKRRGTCNGDLGGPLVIRFPSLQAPLLLGIMYQTGRKFGTDPDIFINLNHDELNEWIIDEIRNN